MDSSPTLRILNTQRRILALRELAQQIASHDQGESAHDSAALVDGTGGRMLCRFASKPDKSLRALARRAGFVDRAGATKCATEVIASTLQVYSKPMWSAQADRHGCGQIADAEIAAWITDYDAADARIRAEQVVLTPLKRKGGLQERRLAT